MDRDKKKKRNKKKKKKQSKASGGNGDTDYSSSSSSVNLNVSSKGYDPFQIQVPEEAYAQNNVSDQNVDLGHHSHLPPTAPEPVTLETEKQRWLQREAILEDTIKHLQNENHSLIQREATLEEMAKQLQDEVYSHEQKEANLEAELVELQAERDSWMEKEVGGLEQSRKSLLQEKQRLEECISDMQQHIRNLEKTIASAHSSNEISEHEDLKSELEGSHALVTKLISENNELVEKVNELYAELGRNDLKVKTAEIGTVANISAPHTPTPTPASSKKPKSSTLEPVKVETFGNDNADGQNARADTDTPQPNESGEIEPFSFDDNEIVDFGKTGENAPLPDPLPLSDAPLIGAPFRLISMVASYVSGDDLVNKSSSDSRNSSEEEEVEVDNIISQQYVN